MFIPTLTIASEGARAAARRRGDPNRRAKGRKFSAQLLAYLASSRLRDDDATDDAIRPLWIALLGSEGELRPFVANLRGGRRATGDGTFFVPKRSYRWQIRKVPGAAIATAYRSDLFHLDPGRVDPKANVRFVCAPPRRWIDDTARTLDADFGDRARDAAHASLFAAFLDRRTPLPILAETRFHLRLFETAERESWLCRLDPSQRSPFLRGERLDLAGLDGAFAVDVEPAALAELITRETARFQREENHRHGTPRLAATRRVLPHPVVAPAQLRLDFALAPA